MKLRKPCPHMLYDQHLVIGGVGFPNYVEIVGIEPDICPGGVFLPDDTLDLEALAAALDRIDQPLTDDPADADAPFVIIAAARWVLDALSVREAE